MGGTAGVTCGWGGTYLGSRVTRLFSTSLCCQGGSALKVAAAVRAALQALDLPISSPPPHLLPPHPTPLGCRISYNGTGGPAAALAPASAVDALAPSGEPAPESSLAPSPASAAAGRGWAAAVLAAVVAVAVLGAW